MHLRFAILLMHPRSLHGIKMHNLFKKILFNEERKQNKTNKYSSVLHFRKNKLHFMSLATSFAIAIIFSSRSATVSSLHPHSNADRFCGWKKKQQKSGMRTRRQMGSAKRTTWDGHRMWEMSRVFLRNMNWFGCDRRPGQIRRNEARYTHRYYFILQMQRAPHDKTRTVHVGDWSKLRRLHAAHIRKSQKKPKREKNKLKLNRSRSGSSKTMMMKKARVYILVRCRAKRHDIAERAHTHTHKHKTDKKH